MPGLTADLTEQISMVAPTYPRVADLLEQDPFQDARSDTDPRTLAAWLLNAAANVFQAVAIQYPILAEQMTSIAEVYRGLAKRVLTNS